MGGSYKKPFIPLLFSFVCFYLHGRQGDVPVGVTQVPDERLADAESICGVLDIQSCE